MNHSIIVVLLIVALGISVCVNVWQSFNIKEVTTEVPVEVPVEVEVPQDSFMENFDIRASYLAIQFKDNDFHFIDGELSLCLFDWYAHWDTTVTITGTSITNCTFYLTNLTVNITNCRVENCSFEGTFDSSVELWGNSFVGTTIFNINVVNGTDNIGLENVIFNESVFQGG